MSVPAPRHQVATRLIHACLAIAVIVQLLTSLVMRHAHNGKPGNIWFPVHEYSGMTAFVLALLFWLNIVVRVGGTDPGALFPWFSARRLKAVGNAAGRYWRALTRGGLPEHTAETVPFAAAIHGLGLLLISYMAASGTWYFVASAMGVDSSLIRPFMEVHGLLGNVVWAYLLGHAAMALLQHYAGKMSIREMWGSARA